MADVYFYKNIEFDVNGSFTMDFLTANGAFSSSVRDSYFNNSSRLYGSITDNNIYIREDMPTRIAYNRDALLNAGVNYIRYRNLDPVSNTFSRWLYAFIEKLEYVDANTTAMTIKIDVLQTYLQEIYSSDKEQFIERCHQDRYNTNKTPIFNTLKDLPSGKQSINKIKQLKEDVFVYYLIVASETMTTIDNYTQGWPLIPYAEPSAQTVQNTLNSFSYYIIPGFKEPNAHINDRIYENSSSTIQLLNTNIRINGDIMVNSGIPFGDIIKNDTSKIVFVSCLPFAPCNIKIGKKQAPNSLGGNDYYFLSSDPSITLSTKEIFYIPGTTTRSQVCSVLKITRESSVYAANIGYFSVKDYITSITSLNYNNNSNRDPLRESKLYSSDYTNFILTDYNSEKEIKAEHITKENNVNLDINLYLYVLIVGSISLNLKLLNYEAPSNSLPYITDFRSQTDYSIPFVVDSLSEFYTGRATSSFGAIATSAIRGAFNSKNSAQGAAGGLLAGTAQYITDKLQAEMQVDSPGSMANEQAANIALGYLGFLIYNLFPIDYKPLCDFWNVNGYPLAEFKKIKNIIESRYWFNYIKTVDSQLPDIKYTPHRLALEELLNKGVRFWHNRNGTFQAFNDYSKENAEVSLL